MSEVNNWYVITGPPSSGTSTAARHIAEQGWHTVEEAARLYIEGQIQRGLTIEEIRNDEEKFQEEIAIQKGIIEATQRPATPTFFVRGMHDTVAYMRLHSFDMKPWMNRLVAESNYEMVFLLDPLPTFEEDGVRNEDPETAAKLLPLLAEAYEECGIEVVPVPVMNPAERASFILGLTGFGVELPNSAPDGGAA